MDVQQQLRGRKIIDNTVAPHHMAFLIAKAISSSASAFVTWFLLCAISLRFQVMALSVVALGDAHYPHAHFSFISRLFSLCFFRCIPTKPTLPLVYVRYNSSLGRLEILSRHSGVGTCIQRQLNVPVLICR